jgi:uncharacterized protein (TIGR02391 family)
MKRIQSNIKPLYSRMLALDIDKYLLSREFKLARIEINIDHLWDSSWEKNTRGLLYNPSIVAEESFGEVIADITQNIGNGKVYRVEFFKVISYILKDFACWSPIKKDFSKVFQSLIDLGYLQEDLDSTQIEIENILKSKPIKLASVDNTINFEIDFWNIIHPDIVKIAKERYEDGYYLDSVFRAITEVNYRVKKIVKSRIGEELDGVSLMRKAFAPKDPIILIANNIESTIDRDIQEGFMQLFAGTCQSVRNPHAHKNEMNFDKDEAVHYLFLISLLMNKIDKSKY